MRYRPHWHSETKKDRGYRFGRFGSSRGRRFFLFFFFILIFGLIPLLITAGIIIVILNLPQPWGGQIPRLHQPVGLVCGGATGLLALALVLSTIARRKVANPLAGILETAEKVTDGDLSARVAQSNGPFSYLEDTFNRMLDELETTDQQRRNLTADVAHELNTPLHILQGYLEGISDGIYPPNETTINMLLDETQLLARLVEDLRTLSLAEAGELPLKIETFPVLELLTDIQTSFSGQSEEAGISLRTDCPADLNINADPDRLNQIISNLVVNALRHTPTGGEIKIHASGSPAGVEIAVTDNGEGIAPEDLPHIFNRFWRKDKSRERIESGGHGLGLAISQQLIRAHGGQITAESEPDKGSTFLILLPQS